MKTDWLPGHAVQMLENGEDYFPRVFEAVSQARREVLIETFILFDDKVGRELREVLIAAAQRGVVVHLTVDGFGSPDLTGEFADGMVAAGVHLHLFDNARRFMGVRFNVLRRMHRKLVTVDGKLAFCGGINYSADHVADFGPESKQDYAMEIRGPLVADIRNFLVAEMRRYGARGISTLRAQRGTPQVMPGRYGHARAMFVTRDNRRGSTDIEREYRRAILGAKSEVVIANAYFFPGYRLVSALRRAAKRGVNVILVLQGQPDVPMAMYCARLLYGTLISAGVTVYEYCERPLHGKVAVIDGQWSTVGSSNLDPLSLSLNLEANVMVHDRAFAADLRGRLQRLIDNHCRSLTKEDVARPSRWRTLLGVASYHAMRRFPALCRLIPSRKPRIETLCAPMSVGADGGSS
ncbi:cardiolipin synthase ClsB [Uliginosibacterium sp. H1]|uniref:cardiolipin synthase ClsB n=1 Tax=Uliginosibacterium sp. H1 TaxID=3114757 RepID=UPI002E184542|nr:cardiolipin synthase ClsB [Uliginosibacterium sp. H1]